jgi:transposase
MRRLPADRLVFLDESGLNTSMARSHAWVKKGREFIERRPMNWGKNLTLLGAMRLSGWVLLSTMFETTNKDRFIGWLVTKLLPRLERGDILLLDNLSAHKGPRVDAWCKRFGIRLLYLPPYSHDFNPIESGWALQKQYVRKHAPRTPAELVRVARRARHRVTPWHCHQWFKHSGYFVQPR